MYAINRKCFIDDYLSTRERGRVDGAPNGGGGRGGAEELYAEWVMRTVHPGWTAREKLGKLAPLKCFKWPFRDS